MAKPIEHGTVNSIATTGWKAGKWAVIGIAAAALLPVALGVGTFLGASALLAASHGVAAVAVGLIGAAITFTTAATTWSSLGWFAAGGGVVGAVRGILGIKAENQAYQNRVENLAQSRTYERQASVNNANIAGMQQGYGMGFQEGQAAVINQLRAAQEQMMMQQMAAQAKGGKGFAAKETEKREVAAVGPQVA